jgi:hypothetical protein
MRKPPDDALRMGLQMISLGLFDPVRLHLLDNSGEARPVRTQRMSNEIGVAAPAVGFRHGRVRPATWRVEASVPRTAVSEWDMHRGASKLEALTRPLTVGRRPHNAHRHL